MAHGPLVCIMERDRGGNLFADIVLLKTEGKREN